jgi:hypothetical protein
MQSQRRLVSSSRSTSSGTVVAGHLPWDALEDERGRPDRTAGSGAIKRDQASADNHAYPAGQRHRPEQPGNPRRIDAGTERANAPEDGRIKKQDVQASEANQQQLELERRVVQILVTAIVPNNNVSPMKCTLSMVGHPQSVRMKAATAVPRANVSCSQI